MSAEEPSKHSRQEIRQMETSAEIEMDTDQWNASADRIMAGKIMDQHIGGIQKAVDSFSEQLKSYEQQGGLPQNMEEAKRIQAEIQQKLEELRKLKFGVPE